MTTIAEFHQRFPTDEACLEHLFIQRFGTDPPCPDCGQPAKWYRLRSVRQFGTNCCRARHIAPQAGTLFAGSALPLRLWFYAMLLFANARSGLSSSFLALHLGINQRSAWRVANAIRLHMTALDTDAGFGGPGESVQLAIAQLRHVRTNNVRGTGRLNLLALADDRRSQSLHYRYRNRRALWGQLQQVVRPGSTLVTEHPGLHEWLCESILRSDHDFQVRLYKGPSSRGPSVTAQNPIVVYLTRMKRWLWTTHLHLNRANAARYWGEFEFRYNRRRQPERAFEDIISAFPAVSLPKDRPKQGISLETDK